MSNRTRSQETSEILVAALAATSLLFGPFGLVAADEGSSGSSRQSTVPSQSTDLNQFIVTPPAPSEPRINSAAVFGVRPGSPFFFKVAATGQQPLKYSAESLPGGLTLNPKTGVITGRITKKGTFPVILKVTNSLGTAQRSLRIVVGDAICLTPPLGWNSWNCWSTFVDQDKVLASAEAMVDHGLIDHGWTYINIDDTWQGLRGGPFGAIQANEKFPDMKTMCGRVHAMGLKIGIYSTPWITSYAGYCGGSSDNQDGGWIKSQHGLRGAPGKPFKRVGTYTFENNDARQWADWGIDYLKYDWRPNDVPTTQRMANALRHCGRDIVYSLSNFAPLENGKDYFQLANCYRTTGDIRDDWDRHTDGPGHFVGIVDIWKFHENWRPYAGPAHHPDPDMLVIGKVGWHETPKPSKLTADEQYTHISLWCLWSAPLLIGCPIEEMDAFTLNLLTNDEVLAVDQDPRCEIARTIFQDGRRFVLAKRMEDGSVVVGLLNRSDEPLRVTASWADLGFAGKRHVRDLWRQKDLGLFDNSFPATVNPHGVVLVRMSATKT